jgi:hypothetical protein
MIRHVLFCNFIAKKQVFNIMDRVLQIWVDREAYNQGDYNYLKRCMEPWYNCIYMSSYRRKEKGTMSWWGRRKRDNICTHRYIVEGTLGCNAYSILCRAGLGSA